MRNVAAGREIIGASSLKRHVEAYSACRSVASRRSSEDGAQHGLEGLCCIADSFHFLSLCVGVWWTHHREGPAEDFVRGYGFSRDSRSKTRSTTHGANARCLPR